MLELLAEMIMIEPAKGAKQKMTVMCKRTRESKGEVYDQDH